MSATLAGIMAGAAAINGANSANHFHNDRPILGAVFLGAAALCIAASFSHAGSVDAIANLVEPYSEVIQTQQLDAENAQHMCGSIQEKLQAAFEEAGGEGQIILACDQADVVPVTSAAQAAEPGALTH